MNMTNLNPLPEEEASDLKVTKRPFEDVCNPVGGFVPQYCPLPLVAPVTSSGGESESRPFSNYTIKSSNHKLVKTLY